MSVFRNQCKPAGRKAMSYFELRESTLRSGGRRRRATGWTGLKRGAGGVGRAGAVSDLDAGRFGTARNCEDLRAKQVIDLMQRSHTGLWHNIAEQPVGKDENGIDILQIKSICS